ncbi:MAG: YjfB family protein [Eubacteriales bacterium]|nr:YjfB family protein [Eubacteriales bacterium]
MDMEGLSMNMSQTGLLDAVGTQVLAMSLDMAEQAGEGLIDMMDRSMMENSVMPELGGNIDIMV